MSSGQFFSKLSLFINFLKSQTLASHDSRTFETLYKELISILDSVDSSHLVNTNEIVWFKRLCAEKLDNGLYDVNRIIRRLRKEHVYLDLNRLHLHMTAVYKFLAKYPADKILRSVKSQVEKLFSENRWEDVILQYDSLNSYVFLHNWGGDGHYCNLDSLDRNGDDMFPNTLGEIFKLEISEFRTQVFQFIT